MAYDLEPNTPAEHSTPGGQTSVPAKGSAERSTMITSVPRARRALVQPRPMQPLQKNLSPVLESRLIAGFSILALLIDHCALCNLVVRPSYLSKKVGYSLLQRCFDVVRRCNMQEVLLEVRQSNRRAIEFYEKNGFRVISLRKNYYRHPPEHAWIMEKRLDKSS